VRASEERNKSRRKKPHVNSFVYPSADWPGTSPGLFVGGRGGPGARCSGYLCYAARSQQATAFHRGGPIGHEGTFLRPDAPHMHGSTGCWVVSAFYHRTTMGPALRNDGPDAAGTPPAPARETTRPTPRPPGAGRVTSGMHGTHGN
jgi:hypothetical protein